MGWKHPNPQNMQYPYGGVMYPQAYPGQTPGTQGVQPPSPFPPKVKLKLQVSSLK